MSGRRRAWAWFAGACLVWVGVGGAVVWSLPDEQRPFERVEYDVTSGRYFGVRGGERWDVSDDVANVVTDGSGRPMLAKLRNRSWIPLWLSDRLGLTEELATYVADLVGEPGRHDLYPKEEARRRAEAEGQRHLARLETEKREAAAREREAIEAGARELEETGRYGIPSGSIPGSADWPDENPNILR